VGRSLFTGLDNEWKAVVRSPASRERLRQWSNDKPEIARFSDLDELARFARSAPSRDERDAILLFLASRAPDDSLACRTVLQCVLFLLIPIAVSFRTTADSDDEIDAIVVATAFERILTYPVQRRPRSVAANIVLDTRQRVSRAQCRPRVCEVPTSDIARLPAGEPAIPSFEYSVGLLGEAVRQGRLTAFDARVIVLTRLCGVDIKEVAESCGYQPHSLRRRRLRAEAILARAVA
jgi:hypothetical protein